MSQKNKGYTPKRGPKPRQEKRQSRGTEATNLLGTLGAFDHYALTREHKSTVNFAQGMMENARLGRFDRKNCAKPQDIIGGLKTSYQSLFKMFVHVNFASLLKQSGKLTVCKEYSIKHITEEMAKLDISLYNLKYENNADFFSEVFDVGTVLMDLADLMRDITNDISKEAKVYEACLKEAVDAVNSKSANPVTTGQMLVDCALMMLTTAKKQIKDSEEVVENKEPAEAVAE